MKYKITATGKIAFLFFALMLITWSSTVIKAQTISSSDNVRIAAASATPSYTIADTGQLKCYNNGLYS